MSAPASYSGNTSGSIAANKIIDDYTEQQSLATIYRPEGPSPEDKPFKTFQQIENENINELETTQTLVEATDKHALTILGEISAIKIQIQQKSAEAYAEFGLNSDFPNVNARLISNSSSSFFGNEVVYHAGISTEI